MQPHPLVPLWRFEVGRGIDVGVFAALSYFGYFAPRSGTNPLDYVFEHRSVGYVLLAAWAAQGLGAWLKQWPLHQRVQRSLTEDQSDAIGMFLFWHAILSGMLFFAGLENLSPGWLDAEGWLVGVGGVAAALVCPLPTLLVWLALQKPDETRPPPPWRSGRAAEFAADQLLLFSVAVPFLTLFSDGAMLHGTQPIAPESLLGWMGALLLVVPLLWIALIWIYVPYRLLLMIEELGTWRSRIACFLALTPLISKYILG